MIKLEHRTIHEVIGTRALVYHQLPSATQSTEISVSVNALETKSNSLKSGWKGNPLSF
jgi:hypothetical protein